MNPSENDDRILSSPGELGAEWRRHPWDQWLKDLKDLKKFMAWIFLATSLLYLTRFLRGIPNTIYQYYGRSILGDLLLAPAFSVAVAVICGIAWWKVWKEKSWARGWAIAASLMHILIFLRQFIIPLQPVPGRHVGELIVGAVGLVTFFWPEDQPQTSG